jgi:hypothetical protein
VRRAASKRSDQPARRPFWGGHGWILMGSDSNFLLQDLLHEIANPFDERTRLRATRAHGRFLGVVCVWMSRSSSARLHRSERTRDQGVSYVDERGVEPLTSPVRAVRKGLTAVSSHAHQEPSTQVTEHSPISPFTSTSRDFRMRCWECVGSRPSRSTLRSVTFTS